MHEMGIALQIIEIATEAIPPEMKGRPVEKINLRIGSLTAVVPDSLTFCLEIAAKGTPLENTAVHIEEVPVTARCQACGNEWRIDTAVFKCPDCQSGDLEMISGRELQVVSIDVADAPG